MMFPVTLELIRKRAEHNEGEISSLEELSLHQQDIERIENLDKWCRELSILYLQANLIPKIENVSRLKRLTYLNMALNNIRKIENLQGCECLEKLDLTLNFVAELSSAKTLTCNEHLRELYLTGNPCTDYTGYRDYLLALLPNLRQLDGIDITRSDRIRAAQQLPQLETSIKAQQELKILQENSMETVNSGKESSNEDIETIREKFTKEKQKYSAESRVEMHKQLQALRKGKDESRETSGERCSRKPSSRSLFAADGRPLNTNEAKLQYDLFYEDDPTYIEVNIHVYKYMETSLINVDVHPTYVTVTVKDKVLQLVLPDEVCPDQTKCQRSQVTGHLLVRMKRVTEASIIRPTSTGSKKMVNSSGSESHSKKDDGSDNESSRAAKRETLTGSGSSCSRSVLDIVDHGETSERSTVRGWSDTRNAIPEDRCTEWEQEAYDDSDVPPLI